MNAPPHQRTDKLTITLVVCCLLQVAIAVLETAGSIYGIATNERIIAPFQGAAEIFALTDNIFIYGNIAARAICAGFFSAWLWCMIKSVRAHVPTFRHKPAQAIWAVFVPLWNLWAPYHLMSDICKAMFEQSFANHDDHAAVQPLCRRLIPRAMLRKCWHIYLMQALVVWIMTCQFDLVAGPAINPFLPFVSTGTRIPTDTTAYLSIFMAGRILTSAYLLLGINVLIIMKKLMKDQDQNTRPLLQ